MMSVIHDANGRGISSENPLSVKATASDVQQPVDLQSRYQQTIQTHNAVSVAASGNSMSTYFDTNGFETVAISLKNDAQANSGANIYWSNDGVTDVGYEASILPINTLLIKSAVIPTKARYFRLQIVNTDAAAHVMSAWAYLKA